MSTAKIRALLASSSSSSSCSGDEDDDLSSLGSLDAGKSFGELALMNANALRNATIITDEDTDLLVIHRNLFNSTLKVSYFTLSKKTHNRSDLGHKALAKEKIKMASSFKWKCLSA